MKLNKLILAFVIVFSFNSFAQQQGDYSKEPGYFDFSELTELKAGEFTTEVYLEEPLLKMVAKMGESKDEEIGDLIGALKLVKVNEFMLDKNNIQKFETDLASVEKNLQSKKWQRIIKTKQKNNNIKVYVKNNGSENFSGLVIAMLNGEGKVTLVNIVGDINPESIGKLSKQFNFPDVGKMKEKEDK